MKRKRRRTDDTDDTISAHRIQETRVQVDQVVQPGRFDDLES